MSAPAEGELQIESESDIVNARRTVRELAGQVGFGLTDVTRIVTAASELARNVYKYAGKGVMHWRSLQRDGCQGLELCFIDHGPGIADLELAMQEGYSTSGGLGLGLPGARRLVDEMELESKPGRETTITLRKWRKS